MLEIDSLSVEVGGKSILAGISHKFESGKTYFLVGKNGSGKSSLALALMGHPKYKVTTGSLHLDGVKLDALSPTERAKKGIFLSLQNVPEIAGVKLGEYLRTIYNERLKREKPDTKAITPFIFRRFLKPFLEKLHIPESFLDRDLNVGFSGGEKRRIEMLQIELLEPRIVIVDEIDSGLDIEAFRDVVECLALIKNQDRTIIVITHNYRMAEQLSPDEVILMKDGQIEKLGGAELLKQFETQGF